MESEPNIYVQAFFNGSMQPFAIIPMETKFGVAYDGEVIAEVAHYEEWEQVAGEPLDENVFQAVVEKIEDNYE